MAADGKLGNETEPDDADAHGAVPGTAAAEVTVIGIFV
jgi:hypothetical protein